MKPLPPPPVALGLLTVLLISCSNPIPPDKATYVGQWQAPTMSLLITQDGSVRYKRVQGNQTTKINAPLKQFAGRDFIVGVGPFKTTFVVSRPPTQDGSSWKMVVDGVELTRTAE